MWRRKLSNVEVMFKRFIILLLLHYIPFILFSYIITSVPSFPCPSLLQRKRVLWKWNEMKWNDNDDDKDEDGKNSDDDDNGDDDDRKELPRPVIISVPFWILLFVTFLLFYFLRFIWNYSLSTSIYNPLTSFVSLSLSQSFALNSITLMKKGNFSFFFFENICLFDIHNNDALANIRLSLGMLYLFHMFLYIYYVSFIS